jgi:predicted 2-oxoglutarate/Fe(II)-dependent dioxygenase YbiX
VLVEEDELREIRKVAHARRMTVAEWVRSAMREARRREPTAPAERKLAVVRAAAKNQLPTAEIDQMLAEIERGYIVEADP